MSLFGRRKSAKDVALHNRHERKRRKGASATPNADKENGPKLRRVTIYQITDTEDGKLLKWTVHGEHVVTLKDSVFEGEVVFTYRVLPKVVEALQGLIREQEASSE